MERSSDWMYEAERDLEHARQDCATGYYNWACFSAQQAAEKSLKAVFHRMAAEAWGHSVVGLLNELSSKVKVSSGLLKACQELDKAYIPTRYPDALPASSPSRIYNRTEAERLIRYAEKVINFCKGILAEV